MSLGSIDAALGPPARSQLQGEAIMGLALLMNILTFPIGLLMTPLIGAVSSTVHSVFGTPGGNVLYVELFVIWLAFVVVGYVQWFALLPRGVRKWKERRLKQSSAQQ
jgi:hypothetical protein